MLLFYFYTILVFFVVNLSCYIVRSVLLAYIQSLFCISGSLQIKLLIQQTLDYLDKVYIY